MAEERVQKILARAGYGSRRASEELISAGRVRINGETAVLGSKADPERDTIIVDNQPIGKAQKPVYVALNKPPGILSEVSPDEPRQTVRDLVPLPGHMFIVGRLDMDSEGLILMTNDGDLANRLTHPRYGHEKEYRVQVGSRPDEEQMEAWRHGVVLEDGHRTAPAQVRLEALDRKGAWLRVILNEGHKRQIREMGKMTGLPVYRIQRIRIGSLLLGDLRLGQWRELRPEEIRALRSNKPAREAGRGGGQRTRPAGAAGRAGRQGAPAGRVSRPPRGDSARERKPAGERGPSTGRPPRQPKEHAPGGRGGAPGRSGKPARGGGAARGAPKRVNRNRQ